MRKIKVGIILLQTVSILFLLACQKTPDYEAVANKQNGIFEIDSKKQTDFANENDIPQGWKTNIEDKKHNLFISVDAIINKPETNSYQTIELEHEIITQSMADHYIDVLIGENDFWLDESIMPKTKAQFEESLLKAKQRLLLYESKGHAGAIQDTQEEIALIEKLIPDAPDNIPIEDQMCDGSFMFIENSKKYVIHGNANLGKTQLASLQISKPENELGGYIIFSNFDDDVGYPTVFSADTDINIKMSTTEAITVATCFLNELGLENFEASLICSAYLPSESVMLSGEFSYTDFPQAYVVYCTRAHNGINTTYYSIQTEDIHYGERYSDYWAQEYIMLIITDTGINYMLYESPVKETSVIENDVTLLPFSEIQKRFESHILTSGSWTNNYDMNITERHVLIDRIELGYVQLRAKDNMVKKMTVPAWSFFGKEVLKYKQQEAGSYILNENNEFINDREPGHCFMMINAIDGTIISPELGY